MKDKRPRTSTIVVADTVKAELARAGVQDNLISRYVSLGLTDQRLEQAKDICATHSVRDTTLLRWLEDGVTLERVSVCLSVKGLLDEETASVPLLNNIANALGMNESSLNSDESIAECIDDIYAVFESNNWRFPLHTLYHRIDERMGGDWRTALYLANNDPAKLRSILLPEPWATAGCDFQSFGKHAESVVGDARHNEYRARCGR